MEATNLTFGDFAEEVLKGIQDTQPDLTEQGMKRLEVASAGLPITTEELATFFENDLQDFGSGAVSMANIRKACEWYAYTHKGRYNQIPDPPPKDSGMVRCTECLQDRCKWNVGYVKQSSPAWRWCGDYTARVHNLSDYRR